MRFLKSLPVHDETAEADPMAGVAQLFDVSVAFIVAVIAAIFTLLSSAGLLKVEKNNQVITRKVTPKNMSGNGVRLGTAYKLENGEVIYVPDSNTK